MINFEYYNPVHVVFGRNTIKLLSDLLAKRKKVLFLYGKGSIKKNGIYEQVKNALSNINHIEYSGIDVNSDYETCLECTLLAEKEKVDFILSVGGSSVLDAAKFISATYFFKGEEPWEIIKSKRNIIKSLPIGTVLTAPATGSEMNCSFVITRRKLKEKIYYSNKLLFPEFSILDPETSFSLSKMQIANGIVVAFIHVLEQYITSNNYSPIQDRLAEALLKTLIEEAPKAMMNSRDYEVQANIMWCTTNALNGILSCGVDKYLIAQAIGFEVTALYNIDYARALAVIIPGLINFIRKENEEKLIQFGERIWNISMGDSNVIIDESIARTSLFFESLGIDTRYEDLNIESDAPEKIAERFEKKQYSLGGINKIKGSEVIKILKQMN